MSRFDRGNYVSARDFRNKVLKTQEEKTNRKRNKSTSLGPLFVAFACVARVTGGAYGTRKKTNDQNFGLKITREETA